MLIGGGDINLVITRKAILEQVYFTPGTLINELVDHPSKVAQCVEYHGMHKTLRVGR